MAESLPSGQMPLNSHGLGRAAVQPCGIQEPEFVARDGTVIREEAIGRAVAKAKAKAQARAVQRAVDRAKRRNQLRAWRSSR